MPNCQVPRETRPSTPLPCPPAPPNRPTRQGEVAPKAPKPPKKVRSLLASLADLQIANASCATVVKVQTFRWTNLALGWYISLLWGRIYAADSARLWVGTNVRLFNVISQQNRISLSSPKGAVDAVGDTIARRIGSISFNSSMTSREV